ncbi:hypothetical protein J3R30DRAFT_3403972 [Lentinula aciculospora]|uniref:Uncharacterized protein n=1 Tax=Lentinula aciculospora TaxID=153920 RepID=A0A9W9ACN9_9AGAR|nr:hypothetical protein J3R30DRAFT_3403972 [Lentinula aciculospora]
MESLRTVRVERGEGEEKEREGAAEEEVAEEEDSVVDVRGSTPLRSASLNLGSTDPPTLVRSSRGVNRRTTWVPVDAVSVPSTVTAVCIASPDNPVLIVFSPKVVVEDGEKRYKVDGYVYYQNEWIRDQKRFHSEDQRTEHFASAEQQLVVVDCGGWWSSRRFLLISRDLARYERNGGKVFGEQSFSARHVGGPGYISTMPSEDAKERITKVADVMRIPMIIVDLQGVTPTIANQAY